MKAIVFKHSIKTKKELCMTVGKLPIVKLIQNNVLALYKEIQPHKVSYQFSAPVMIQKAKLNLHINSEVS